MRLLFIFLSNNLNTIGKMHDIYNIYNRVFIDATKLKIQIQRLYEQTKKNVSWKVTKSHFLIYFIF